MQQFELIQNYKSNDKYRESFNQLTKKVFGFDFENWYQKGFWDDRYVPYSYLDRETEQVVANVSVNIMDLVVEGEKKKAIQLGTVMTHPDYRGKGLAAALMEYVLEKYEHGVDFFYLFANESVLEFYPKFGFQPVQESQFTLEVKPGQFTGTGEAQKFDTSKIDQLQQIHQLFAARRPVSEVFGVNHGESIGMFYCLYVFGNCFYSLEDGETVVVCKKSKGVLHLYDVISSKEVDLHQVVSPFIDDEVEKIVFYFTPDLLGAQADVVPYSDDDDTFFVRGNSFDVSRKFKCPITAQA